MIQHHLAKQRVQHPDVVGEIEKGLYVDDLLTGASTAKRAQTIKNKAVKIFGEARMELHKWNSNAVELDVPEGHQDSGLSFANQQIGAPPGVSALLGLMWNKQNDTISVTFPLETVPPTKRGVLRKVAKIYDPLGLVAPLSLQGKLLYRSACDVKCEWDSKLPDHLMRSWRMWESKSEHLHLVRSLTTYREPIGNISLHAFGDASGHGVAAAVYAIVEQQSGINRGLVVSRARLAT